VDRRPGGGRSGTLQCGTGVSIVRSGVCLGVVASFSSHLGIKQVRNCTNMLTIQIIALCSMNIILLKAKNGHVSAAHVNIFSVESERTQMCLVC